MAPSSPPPKGKKVSRKWSEAEVSALVAAISHFSGSSEGINWAEIARSVPGRTGKQCREKYKNDLRPDISKDPWVSREEYILARAHCDVGNQWAEIAKYLPGRSENSIKNHWNATLRSKAEAKSRTFLWVYGRTVLQQQGVTCMETFEKATHQYGLIPQAEPLDVIRVPEEYFQGRKQVSNTGSPIKVKIGHATKTKPSRHSRRRADDSSDSEDDFAEYDSTEDESSQLCSQSQPAPRSTRSSVRASTTSSQPTITTAACAAPGYDMHMDFTSAVPAVSSGMPKQAVCPAPSEQCMGIPLDGDAMVTIHLKGPAMSATFAKPELKGMPAMLAPSRPPRPPTMAQPPSATLKTQQWQMPQAPENIPTIADEWADSDYMAFLQEFSMDAGGVVPAPGLCAGPQADAKVELQREVDKEADDLELFHLLGDLSDEVATSPSVCKGGLGNLPGLDMQDPAHAFTTYPADPIGSMFDMGMHTNFCQAPTLPNSFDTNGKTSQQSTSDSYDIMSYPQMSATTSPLGMADSPFQAFALYPSFCDFSAPVPMASLDAVATAPPPLQPLQLRTNSMPPRPPTTTSMLPPRQTTVASHDSYGWKAPTYEPVHKRVSSDALPYSGSYTGMDMFAPPTKRASFSGSFTPAAMAPAYPAMGFGQMA